MSGPKILFNIYYKSNQINLFSTAPKLVNFCNCPTEDSVMNNKINIRQLCYYLFIYFYTLHFLQVSTDIFLRDWVESLPDLIPLKKSP